MSDGVFYHPAEKTIRCSSGLVNGDLVSHNPEGE
jgi:hypothetical protein